MIETGYMIAPLGALKAAAKILKLPVVKVGRGQYRIDITRSDKIKLNTWILAKHKMDNHIDTIYHRTIHGSCETGYRMVK